MKNLKKIPLGLLALGIILTFFACTTRLDFSRAAAYNSPLQVDKAVLISLPQSLENRMYKVKVGKLWEAMVLEVPVMDAYKNEVSARMKGVFTGGVTVITDEALAQIRQASPETGVANQPPARDLEEILADLTETEKFTRGEINRKDIADDAKVRDLKKENRQEELTQEALRAASLEMMDQRDYGYILEFQDAQLGMVDRRFLVSYRVKLINYESGDELLNKRYQARSRVFDPRRNNKTNEAVVLALVKEAFSGAMSQTMADMVNVSELR